MFRTLLGATIIRPVTTTMVTIAVVLFGFVAAMRLPVELLPDLSYPTITVQTTYPDAAPAEVEELITRPVEELVGAVPGVVRLESTSREGQSEVTLDFSWGTRMDNAMADVREKLDRVNLPMEADRPIVLRYDPSQEPIMRLALVAPEAVDASTLRDHADRAVKRELEKLEGVAAVQIHGGDEDEVVVALDPTRLAALSMDPQEVVDAISRSNVNRPGGALTERKSRFLIRTLHEARTPDELGKIIIRSQEGAELRLEHVASVRRTPVEREELAIVDGREAVELAVYREGDANTVAAANGVLRAIETLPLAAGEKVTVLSNQASFIESAIDEVQSNVLVGGALAVCVLLFFLRDLRATLIIAASIPISLLATFIPLKGLEVSLNLMSLGGLALGVGMLVDNGIVVLESVARVREDNPDMRRRAAATRGTADVAPSVVASTLTTVAVFFPMVFVEGVAGQIVRDLSYAVSFSILSSMLVSLTLVPVLLGLEGGGSAERPAGRSPLGFLLTLPAYLWWPIGRLVKGLGAVGGALSAPLMTLYAGLENRYPRLLGLTLRHRGVVLLGAVGLCVVSVGLSGTTGQTLLPQVEQHEFFVQVQLPQGTSLERTAELTRQLGAALADDPRVESTFARVGSVTQGDTASGTTDGTHLAQINVRLSDQGRVTARDSQAALFAKVEAANTDASAALRLAEPALFTFDPPIELQIFSEDPSASIEHARALLPELRKIDGLTDVIPDDLSGRPEVRVQFDRERIGRLGLSIEGTAGAVRRAIQGDVATKLHAPDRQLDVRVRLPRVDRDDVSDVSAIQVGVVDGVPVRLSAVADVEAAVGPAEIRRIDGRRGIRIRSRVDTSDLAAVAADVNRVVRGRTSPGVTAQVSGQAEEMEGSLRSLIFTALLSSFLVYVVMASSFESLHHPFLIMFTVPLAVAGALAACLVLGLPLSAMVGIGVIILGGIVVNNAIVLVNAVNQRRGAGADVTEALIAAGRNRVRPIVMTTLTTVLGLLPMALGLGDGAALRQPLAVAVIGGLITGTALTLLVLPAAYSLVPGARRDAWSE